MISISDTTKEALRSDACHKELIVTFPNIGLTLRNEDIISESMSLQESIQSSGDLDYKGCCASVFELEIFNTAQDLTGQQIVVSLSAEQSSESVPLFYGKVASCKKQTADALTKKIIAYDPLADILQQDCTEWYLGLAFPMRVIDFRDAFWDFIGYPQEEIQLINDFIWIQQGLDGKSKISGKTIIESICEFNACFGIFNRQGTWTYQYLNDIYEGLYPADDLFPDDLLFPSSESPDSEQYSSAHILDIDYEDFTTKCVDKVLVLDKEGYVIGEAGTGTNIFIVANNFLSFGITPSESQEAAQKIFEKINMIDYVPCDITSIATPWVECSDIIVFQTQTDIFRSYILSRRTTGIQVMKDDFTSEGEEYRNTNLDSVETKLNTLSADISTEIMRATAMESELTSNLSSLEESTSSRFDVTNSAITAEVRRAGEAESKLEIKANSIDARVTSVSGSVAELELKVDSNGRSIANLSADIVNINGSVTNINSDIVNINADLTSVRNLAASKITASEVDAKISSAFNSVTWNSLVCIGTFIYRQHQVKIANDGTLYVEL